MKLTDSRVWIPTLELGLGLWQGEYRGKNRQWLRWYRSYQASRFRPLTMQSKFNLKYIKLHCLPSYQLDKQSLLRSQLLKTALLNYPSCLEYIDPVSVADCAEPVGDHYSGNLQPV